jgi:hypothetical protein
LLLYDLESGTVLVFNITAYEEEDCMMTNNILESRVDINALSDENGRRYFNIRVIFSETDALTVYRNSMDELLEDLPKVLDSAIRARIIHDKEFC